MQDIDFLKDQAKKYMQHPERIKDALYRKKADVKIWAIVFVVIVLVFFLVSSRDFSFALTLSVLFEATGIIIMLIKTYGQRSCSGVSLQTMICYAIVCFFRLSSVLFHEGYLPYDKSGDWFYQMVEFFSLACCLGVIYLMLFKFRGSYEFDLDSIKAYYLVPVPLVLALLIHPGLNNSYLSDCSWTFAQYLEAVAMFPQLYLFQKKGGEIEAFTSHFVASEAISKALNFIFWVYSFHELNDYHGRNNWTLFSSHVGYFVIFAQVLQIILMADFFYHYVKSLMKGERIVISV